MVRMQNLTSVAHVQPYSKLGVCFVLLSLIDGGSHAAVGRMHGTRTRVAYVGACEAHAFETHETQSTRAAVSTRMAWLAGARPDALQAREASPPKKSTLMARSRSWPSQPPYSELRNSRKERRCARRCDHARHAANQVTYRRYRCGEP